jgi:thioredoxin 1
VLENLAAKQRGKLLVVKVDTDKDQRFASSLGVQGIPAVFLYKGGKVVNQATGTRPLNFWEELVVPHLGS